jgi:hypothetical protein
MGRKFDTWVKIFRYGYKMSYMGRIFHTRVGTKYHYEYRTSYMGRKFHTMVEHFVHGYKISYPDAKILRSRPHLIVAGPLHVPDVLPLKLDEVALLATAAVEVEELEKAGDIDDGQEAESFGNHLIGFQLVSP